MGMSDFYGPRDDEQSIATLLRAVDLGVTLFDTADMYGPYTNERLVGHALAPLRDRVLIATKFGFVRDLDDPTKRTVRGTPEYVRERLRRQPASGSASITSTSTTSTASIRTRRSRKRSARWPSSSRPARSASSACRRRAPTPSDVRTRVHPIAALQSEYSLWSRDIEDEIIATCRELGITIVPYSPLGRGFLTGAIRRFEDSRPRTTSGAARHASRARTSRRISRWSMPSQPWPRTRAAHRRNSRSHGCWRRATTWCRFPEHAASRASKRTSPPPRSRSTTRNSRRLESITPKGTVAGERYAADGMKFIGG